MNQLQFKRHDADGDVFINPAHVSMVEPSGIGDDNVTDIVVAAQAGLALVRGQEPIKDVVVDNLRREPAGSATSSRRAKKTSKSPASSA